MRVICKSRNSALPKTHENRVRISFAFLIWFKKHVNTTFKIDKLLSICKPSLVSCLPHNNYQLIKISF